MARHHYKDSRIEVAKKRRDGVSMPLSLMFEADFVLDLTTFRVLKHRLGDREGMTPLRAAEWLTEYLDDPLSRVLLLVD